MTEHFCETCIDMVRTRTAMGYVHDTHEISRPKSETRYMGQSRAIDTLQTGHDWRDQMPP